MKPFDLKKALAGEPVVTRDGKEVTRLHKFDCEDQYPLYAVVDEMIKRFTIDGNYIEEGINRYDLFMDEPTKWVNIYFNSHSNHVTTGAVYETEEEAKLNGFHIPNFQCTIKLK
jgi:hypothetical protein